VDPDRCTLPSGPDSRCNGVPTDGDEEPRANHTMGNMAIVVGARDAEER